MIDHDVGVSPTQPYVLKKVDEDYFDSSEELAP
jgi:restriction endonuclease Mrr